MAKQDIAALLIGGGAKSPEGDDRKALAEKAFAKAVKSGNGIADALEELLSVIEGDEEPEDMDVPEEDAVELDD